MTITRSHGAVATALSGRLQLLSLSTHACLAPSSVPKCHQSRLSWRQGHAWRTSRRRLLCSQSGSQIKSDSGDGDCSQSIVGDLLGYLNESWTQFHATVNTEGFKPNPETHLVPLLATKLEEMSLKSDEKTTPSSFSGSAHHPLLLQLLSEELGCNSEDIMGIELNVCDTQPSCLGGGKNEFIFSGRLDNLASCYVALRALIDSCKSPAALANEQAIRMVALFDNEEVGSNSVQGAGAPTMFQAMRRIADHLAHEYIGESAFERAVRSSFLVSADMAHGVHPNFSDKHEEHHRPQLQKGLVIKHNANQRYATSAITAFLFKEVANARNLPMQEFVVRNDMACGSTIGPILATGVGIRTVDCGIPQLSMHSIREICGKEDIVIAYKLFMAFFQTFTSIDKKLKVDF